MDNMAKEAYPFYEYIVVGLGGIGSGALYWLSKKSENKVLGLEQYRLGHDHGGSQDHSRIIRHMYNDKMYTKLTRHTYNAWAAVEEESGTQLVYKTGSLDIARKGTPGIKVLEDYAKAMDANNIPYQRLSGPELRQKFPQWTVVDETEALLQPEGGLVDAALGNSVHVQLARAHGAIVMEECPVSKLEPIPNDQCLVHTTKGTFRCRRVVITCGAWLNNLLGTIGIDIPVTVTQEQVTYYATPNIKMFTKQNFPVYIYHTAAGFDLYGLPTHVNSASKIGIDTGGPAVTPESRTYRPDPVREELCLKFLRANLPKSIGPLLYSKTCLYTMTLDRHFLVDALSSRGMPQVIVCCGAGHAYKFASFLGLVLSELAVEGKTQYDIDGFRFNREAIQNKHYKPVFWRGDIGTAKL